MSEYETQQTIAEWMNATFPGADPESPRKALRALEELVELCVAAGARPADICLAVAKETKGLSHMQSRPEPDKVPAEAADVLIVLYGVAAQRGFDLHAEVDKKMSVNRLRRWQPRGDGTGYHIKEDTPVASDTQRGNRGLGSTGA